MSAFFHYLGAFSLMLGVLIVIHELGHYLVARLFGVRVLKFSIGFGPTLWSRPMGRDRTEWSLGVIPLGGYVKFLDERDTEVAPEERHRTFNRQTVWRRMGIVAAGPAANLLMAIAVYWGLFAYGTQELRPVLGAPVALSPAAKAGIERGEQVLKIGQQTVQTWQEMRWELLRQAANQEIVSLEVIKRLLDSTSLSKSTACATHSRFSV